MPAQASPVRKVGLMLQMKVKSYVKQWGTRRTCSDLLTRRTRPDLC
jgi:hypothetical protein